MTRESEYISLLADEYKNEGWEPVRPNEASSILSFEPDLVLQRGTDYLVVDVKEAGYKETRALNVIRRLVEANDHWKFEVKIIPTDWRSNTVSPVANGSSERIKIAKALLEKGHDAEAFILAWTAVEGLLRESILSSSGSEILPIPTLIRTAFENGKLDKEQLLTLETCVKARNRLVHGVPDRLTRVELDRLLTIASNLAEAAG